MLLDDIIELATDNQQSIAVLLRKCLVLAHRLKNERLKTWANKELNGYEHGDELPDYRIAPAQAKGHFSGWGGSSISNWPIPSALLEPQHQRFAKEVRLTESISAYEDIVAHKGTICLQWPADLVLYYQNKIPNTRDMGLVAAYQEIPRGAVVELLDVVRTRVLNMALEIQSEVAGKDEDDLKHMTPQETKQIDQTIVNNIFGGNVYVAAGQSSMTATTIQQNISAGDWDRLEKVLRSVGMSEPELSELSEAVDNDGKKLGGRVTGWVKKNAHKVLSGGVNVATSVGEALLIEYLKQYFGMG
jgi:hypothetical protein